MINDLFMSFFSLVSENQTNDSFVEFSEMSQNCFKIGGQYEVDFRSAF